MKSRHNRSRHSSLFPAVVLLLVIALGGFGYSGYHAFLWVKGGMESSQATERLIQNAVAFRSSQTAEGQVLTDKASNPDTIVSDTGRTDPTKDAGRTDSSDDPDMATPGLSMRVDMEAIEGVPILYETAPILVDFDVLRVENSDIIGWIYCEDTVINYPIVQGKDNNYYLTHLADGSYNKHGALFLDCRCDRSFQGENNVIHGHHMKDQSMFGSLAKYKAQEYYDAHPVMYLLTPDADYKIELLAGCVLKANSQIYSLPVQEGQFAELLIQMVRKSTFHSRVEEVESNRFLTLSTCSYEYDNARYVVVGEMFRLEEQ